jgi:phage terminase large subunit-like protein
VLRKTKKQLEALDGIKNNDIIALWGGSRSGKTVLAIHCLVVRAILYPGSTHLVVRKFSNSVRRSIWMQTLPFVIKSYDGLAETIQKDKTQQIITFNNGSKILCLGCDTEKETDKILGIETSTLFVDEITELSYEQFGVLQSRLAEKKCKSNKTIVCCNPTSRKSWVYKLFIEHKNPVSGEEMKNFNPFIKKLNPGDNAENIADGYIEVLKNLSDRQKLRFYDGEWLSEIEGALFKFDFIERNRKKESEYEQILVSVDPAVTNTDKSDETGIIVVGKKGEDYYVLRDESGKYSPVEAARKIVALRRLYKANKVVCETNQGGDFILSAISQQDKECPVYGVHQKVGKLIRAEPVAFLYEKNKVHHIACFPELEDQLISYNGTGSSPDRLDALCTGISELSNTKELDLHFGDAAEKNYNVGNMGGGMYIEKD